MSDMEIPDFKLWGTYTESAMIGHTCGAAEYVVDLAEALNWFMTHECEPRKES